MNEGGDSDDKCVQRKCQLSKMRPRCSPKRPAGGLRGTADGGTYAGMSSRMRLSLRRCSAPGSMKLAQNGKQKRNWVISAFFTVALPWRRHAATGGGARDRDGAGGNPLPNRRSGHRQYCARAGEGCALAHGSDDARSSLSRAVNTRRWSVHSNNGLNRGSPNPVVAPVTSTVIMG